MKMHTENLKFTKPEWAEPFILFLALVSTKVFELAISRVISGVYKVIDLFFKAVFHLPVPDFSFFVSPAAAIIIYGSLVFMYIVYKMPKLGAFTFYALLNSLYFYEMGVRYINFFVPLIIAGILVDLILALSNYEKTYLIALSYAMMGTPTFVSPYFTSVWFYIAVFLVHFLGIYIMYKPMRCLFPIKFDNEILTALQRKGLIKKS